MWNPMSLAFVRIFCAYFGHPIAFPWSILPALLHSHTFVHAQKTHLHTEMNRQCMSHCHIVVVWFSISFFCISHSHKSMRFFEAHNKIKQNITHPTTAISNTFSDSMTSCPVGCGLSWPVFYQWAAKKSRENKYSSANFESDTWFLCVLIITQLYWTILNYGNTTATYQ